MKNKHLLGLENYPIQDIQTIIDLILVLLEIINGMIGI